MATVNVTKRGDYWQYRFDVAKVDGKRKQVSKSGFKTKKEAQTEGTKALAKYNNAGVHFEPTEISLSDYLDYWLKIYGSLNLKYNTILSYENIIERHLKPNLGMYRLKALNPATIQEYVNKLRIEGFSRSHAIGIITTLSGALKYAVEPLHYIEYNPCSQIVYPPFRNERGKHRYIISNDDFIKIIERFPPTTPFYLPLMIGYYTGLRVGEVFGLTWDDIDMEKRTITINKIIIKRFTNHIKNDKTTWYFSTPKTETSTRTIKFGQTLYDALKYVKYTQLENEMKYGEFYTLVYAKPELDENGDTVQRLIETEKSITCTYPRVRFINVKPSGEMLSCDSMKYPIRVIKHELNIAFNFHSLRHTHATLLIENGADIKDVQTRLGHANIETTLNTYVHNTEKMEDRSVDVFEKATKKITS